MGAVQPALVAIWLSVLLGAALGVWQRFAPRVTEPIRTFAVVAAALVVSLSLLPHALQSEGLGGLLGAAGGYAAIPALERLGMVLFRRGDPQALRLELGYGGLLLHRFGDGVTMSVEGHGHGVLWALGAHEIPIVALVTLAFAPRGLRVALLRATGLGLSSSFGYFLVGALPASSWHALHGWADAAAAGVLIHVVAHEGLRTQTGAPVQPLALPPRSLPQRMLDLGAALLACGLIAALSLDHDSAALGLLQNMLQVALVLSPWLCLGLLLRVTLQRLELRHSLSIPGRSLDPVLLGSSLALLGPYFAAVQLALGLLLTVALLALRPRARPDAGDNAHAPKQQAPLLPFGAALEQELVKLAGWVLLGLLGATYVQAHVPPLVEGGAIVSRLAWTATLAALACGSAPAAIPLAAALLALGLPPAAALAGLMLGIAVPLILGGERSVGLSPRTTRTALLCLMALVGVLVARLEVPLLPAGSAQPMVAISSALSWISLAALLIFIGRSIWQTGVRTWLVTSLGSSLWPGGSHRHEHASPGHG